jgi:peptidoglycan L-alanyl-D-glutamate endopeptidase CwlK
MPSFSDKSHSRLGTCDPRLQQVFHEVIRHFDCTILEGHRDKERQNRMVEEGRSKVRWPDGKHNTVPSMAVDVTPYPIVWDDRERQTLFAGYVLATAKAMGVDLRWGGDWDSDTEVRDNSFDDLVHFEIVE